MTSDLAGTLELPPPRVPCYPEMGLQRGAALTMQLAIVVLPLSWLTLLPSVVATSRQPLSYFSSSMSFWNRMNPFYHMFSSDSTVSEDQYDAVKELEAYLDVLSRRTSSFRRSGCIHSNVTTPKSITGVYLGWLGHGSVGDEMLVDVLIELLKFAVQDYFPRGTVVTSKDDPLYSAADGRCAIQAQRVGENLTDRLKTGNVNGCDFVVLGGGSTILNSRLNLTVVKQLVALGKPLMIFGSGVQQPLLNRLVVGGLSFLQDAQVLGGGRGPMTQKVLKAANVDVPVILDPGTLVSKYYKGLGPAEIARKLDLNTSLPIAVLSLKARPEVAGQDQRAVWGTHRYMYQSLVRNLATTHQVVLQPMDPTSVKFHEIVANISNRQIGRSGCPMLAPVKVHNELQNWGAIVDLMYMADYCFSGRVHAAVLCGSAGLPMVLFGNSSKLRDYAASIGMPNIMLLPEGLDSEDEAVKMQVVKRIRRKIEAVRKRRDEVKQLMTKLQRLSLQIYQLTLYGLLSSFEQTNREAFAALQCCRQIEIAKGPSIHHKQLIGLTCKEVLP